MSRRLVFGTGRLVGLKPIGEIDGKPIYPIRGAEGSEEDSGAKDDDSDEDGSQEDEDDDQEDEDEERPAAKRKQRGQDRSTAYINQLKKELRTVRKELTERKKADREAELKDKSEVDRTKAEKDEVATELAALKPKYQDTLTQLEIIKTSSQLKLNWNDVEDVLNDRKLRDAIEIDDDGEISGVEDALKDLAKRKPHFLAAKADESDEDDSSTNGSRTKTKTGASFSGSKGKNNDRTADRNRLLSRYQVLGNMVDSGGI